VARFGRSVGSEAGDGGLDGEEVGEVNEGTGAANDMAKPRYGENRLQPHVGRRFMVVCAPF